jgi:uncharacterized protein (TIGR00255 family)
MTGYGTAQFEVEGCIISIDIKALNSKSLEMSFKLSRLIQDKEVHFRNSIARILQRGKVMANVMIELPATMNNSSIDQEKFEVFYSTLNTLKNKLSYAGEITFSEVLQIPEVVKSNSSELDETIWDNILTQFEQVCKQVDQFRMDEGKALLEDIKSSIANIRKFSNDLSPFETERISKVREKLNGVLQEYIAKESIDQNRLEQELLFYAEKFDINEEKVRLSSHLDFFEVELKNAQSGKKLGFIAQEIGREINTIGSKSNHAEMQKIVVCMKEELEKIKEQLNNVL